MANSSSTSNSQSGSGILRIETLGKFFLSRHGEEIPMSAWKREKALHLFQFFVTHHATWMHKEQIIDMLWPELKQQEGDQHFKVALHALHKVLEPRRKRRAAPHFVQRQELTYGLNLAAVEIDTDLFEAALTAGNQCLPNNPEGAIIHYQEAVALYKGDYLPERRYEDWSSAERERLQLLALTLMTRLAELLIASNPLESIYLTQQVLRIDPVWEDAYRTQMRAYLAQGNRPLAVRTYQKCVEILDEEFGLGPLPETIEVYEEVCER